MQTGSFSKIYSIKQEKNWIQFFYAQLLKAFWYLGMSVTLHCTLVKDTINVSMRYRLTTKNVSLHVPEFQLTNFYYLFEAFRQVRNPI